MRILYRCTKCNFKAKLRPEHKEAIEKSHQKAYYKDETHVLVGFP